MKIQVFTCLAFRHCVSDDMVVWARVVFVVFTFDLTENILVFTVTHISKLLIKISALVDTYNTIHNKILENRYVADQDMIFEIFGESFPKY